MPAPPADSPAPPAASDLAAQYADTAARIVSAVRAENRAWDLMEQLCDGIGHRLSGSPQLERAIQWAVETLESAGHENVHTESVMVPHWERGRESLVMTAPREMAIPILGLGGSVATPPEGLTAPVLVVNNWDELAARAADAAGKIVLFNARMPADDEAAGAGYGPTVQYRTHGARRAAEHGAVAALVRSVTTRSLQTPHTGAMRYGDAQRKIPAAAISVEAAEMLARLQARGTPATLRLSMEARVHEQPAVSANVIAELRGREKPDEIVVIGGHFDSWDVGQGAHDDGGGCVIAMEALGVLRRLDLRPRRTIRVVLWTNEENGLAGGRAYAEQHADELANHVAAIESDAGVFRPLGYRVDVEDDARRQRVMARIDEILSLLEAIGDLRARKGGGGADISPMRPAGVPLLGHDVDMTHYFDIHHTHADTLDKVDPAELTDNLAVLAVTAYVIADMEPRLGQ